MISKYFVSLLALAASVPLSQAASPRAVTDIIIDYPHSGVVWHEGEDHTVHWHGVVGSDVTHSDLYLGYFDASSNALFDGPLAKNVPLGDNQVKITVPTGLNSGHYQVYFTAGGGFFSQTFTIV